MKVEPAFVANLYVLISRPQKLFRNYFCDKDRDIVKRHKCPRKLPVKDGARGTKYIDFTTQSIYAMAKLGTVILRNIVGFFC